MGKLKSKELGKRSFGKRINEGLSRMRGYEDSETVSESSKEVNVEVEGIFQPLDEHCLNISEEPKEFDF